MFHKRCAIFVAGIFLLIGCSNELTNDKKLEKQIVGTWHKELKHKGKIIHITTKFTHDHRFATYGRVSNSKHKLYAVGKWRIRFGHLIETITKSNFASRGVETSDKILTLTARQFAYKRPNGEVFSYYRTQKR